MEGTTIQQAADLGLAAMEYFEKDKIAIPQKYTKYNVLNYIMGEKRKVIDGGDRITWSISLGDAGNARHIRMYETYQPRQVNTVSQGKAEWTHAINSFSYSVKELAMAMPDKRRVYNLFETRKKVCIHDFANMIEERVWSSPTNATDDLNPHGIPAWLSLGDNNSTGGFTGYNGRYKDGSAPGTAYNIGNIASSLTANDRWASYYADHNGILGDNLCVLLSRAFLLTEFRTPLLPSQIFEDNDFANFMIYTNDNVIINIETLLRKSDDRVGYDLGKYAGRTTFKGIPFNFVDILRTADTDLYGTDPIYGVNLDKFHAAILEGQNFVWDKPLPRQGQPGVLEVDLNLTYGYFCDDRRTGGFLISQHPTS